MWFDYICLFYCYDIHLSIFLNFKSLITRFLWEHPISRWLQWKSLHLSLSKHSLLACASYPPLSASFSFMYSFILCLYLLSVLPVHNEPLVSLTLFFTNSSPSEYDQSISMCFIYSYSFHYFILHSICRSSHAILSIYASIALTLPSCGEPTCLYQITHFHCIHS